MSLKQESEDLQYVVESLEPGDRVEVATNTDEYSGYVLRNTKVIGEEGRDEYVLTLMPWDIDGVSHNKYLLAEYDVSSPKDLSSGQAKDIADRLDELTLSQMPVRTRPRYSPEEGRGHIENLEVVESI